MTAGRRLVSLIDDDESVRESLPDLLGELGFAVQAFASADEFLASADIAETACMIIDVVMPGISGPDLHRELLRRGHTIPTIFITALADERERLGLLGPGVVECLSKPFSDQALRAALDKAIPG